MSASVLLKSSEVAYCHTDILSPPGNSWRALARSLANRPAAEIKRVIAGVTPEEAVASFARLWVADEHWEAADRVMRRR